MPYCNHCGNPIDAGNLCAACTETEGAPEEETIDGEGAAEVLQDLPTIREEAPPFAEIETENTTPPAQEADTDGETGPEEAPSEETPDDTAARERGYLSEKLARLMSTPDRTRDYSAEDIGEHRRLSALSYLWLLWLIPFFCARSSRFVRYHLGQGILLILWDCIAVTLAGIGYFLGSVAPVAAPAVYAVAEVVLLVSLFLKVFGIVSCLAGRARDLPGVEKFRDTVLINPER